MRKLMIAGGVVVMLCISSAISRADLTWGYAADLYDWDPELETGWLVQMYHDVNADTLLADITSFWIDGTPSGGNSSDDVLLSEFSVFTEEAKDELVFGDNYSPGVWAFLEGEDVYSVLFNASTIGSATEAVILDATPFTLPDSDPATYAISAVNNDWVSVIPEPGTMGLFAMGVVGLMAYRRRRAA